jgi:hypothetical protein
MKPTARDATVLLRLISTSPTRLDVNARQQPGLADGRYLVQQPAAWLAIWCDRVGASAYAEQAEPPEGGYIVGRASAHSQVPFTLGPLRNGAR